jgi:hypothetical protein
VKVVVSGLVKPPDDYSTLNSINCTGTVPGVNATPRNAVLAGAVAINIELPVSIPP